MSYISIIVPAFHLNTIDINEINNYCCSQFNISPENFQLVEFENNKYKDKINYGIIFKESNLSLQTIEQLIYERNCIQNLSEKVFESLQLNSKKINDLEYLINSRKDLMHNLEKKFYQKNIDKEEEKNNNILDSLKDNEKRKIEYSEKAINKIKIDFKNMVDELDLLNKKINNKKYIQKDIISKKVELDLNEENENYREKDLFFTECI